MLIDIYMVCVYIYYPIGNATAIRSDTDIINMLSVTGFRNYTKAQSRKVFYLERQSDLQVYDCP